MIKLFIDDERFPPNDGNAWHIARNYDDAITFLLTLPVAPNYISFDNDLGSDSKEGCQIADWIIERDLDCEGTWLPDDFRFYVHSQNCTRRDYINGTLNRYLEYKRS